MKNGAPSNPNMWKPCPNLTSGAPSHLVEVEGPNLL